MNSIILQTINFDTTFALTLELSIVSLLPTSLLTQQTLKITYKC